MKKAISPIFFICLFTFTGCTNKKLDFAEKNLQDSLHIYLDLANQDSVPYESRFQYNKKAFEIIKNQENDSMHRVYLFRVANRYFNMVNLEEFYKISKIVLKESLNAKDSSALGKAHIYIGDYYYNKLGKLDSSLINYKKSEKIYLNLNDSVKLGEIYMNISNIYDFVGDFTNNEFYTVKALKILKGNKNNYNVLGAYNSLGLHFSNRGEYEKSLEYYNKALQIINSNEFPPAYQSKATLFNNIGVVYQNLNDHKKAIGFFKEALNQKNLIIDNPLTHSLLLDNLGLSNFRMRNYSVLPELYYQSLKIKDSIGNAKGIVYSKVHLSEYFAKVKKIQKSLNYAYEAFDLSKKGKMNKEILMCLKHLANIEPQKAAFYKQEYIKLNDSLHFEQRKMQNKFARIEFETDEFIQEKDRAVNQKATVLWISISIILGGFLFYAVRIQQSKKRELLLLRSRQKANEEIYQLILDQQQKFDQGREKEKKRIAKELHDGIMNRLASIRFNLFVLENKTDPATIAHCLNQAAQIEEVEKEVSSIAQDLSYDVFSSKKSYAEFLKTAIAEFAVTASLKAQVAIDNTIDWEAIDSLKKLNLYRILQESLHNIRKHAQAGEIKISFKKNNSLLEIEISDNGIGFNPQDHTSGQGIKNIESRAKEIGADLKIITAPGQGTAIKITVPLETNPN